jgi:hypothetical protein
LFQPNSFLLKKEGCPTRTRKREKENQQREKPFFSRRAKPKNQGHFWFFFSYPHLCVFSLCLRDLGRSLSLFPFSTLSEGDSDLYSYCVDGAIKRNAESALLLEKQGANSADVIILDPLVSANTPQTLLPLQQPSWRFQEHARRCVFELM